MSIQAAPEAESPVVSEPQRVGVKVFVEDQEAFDRARMIEVFHRWIQEDRLPGRSSTYMITRTSQRGPECF